MSKDWIGNYNSIFKCIGANNHCNHDYEEFGFYATDPIAIDKLLTVERPNINIWEICAGNGHLAQRLKDYGYAVTTSDIVQRDYPLDFVEDFLQMKENETSWIKDCDILTNPPFKCVDKDTECFTKRGWLKYFELKETDEILSINPNTLLLEWSKIDNLVVKEIDEDVYHFKKSHIDILCTKGHRMFAFYNGKIATKNGDLIHSEDVHSTHYIPRTGYKWLGNTNINFVLPSTFQKKQYTRKEIFKEEKIIPMDKWLKFFGMWLADGYCRATLNTQKKDRYVIGIKQLQSKGNMIRQILDGLPFKYREYIDNYNRVNSCINFEIYDKQLWDYLKRFGKSTEKYIPSEIKELSPDLLKILLDFYFKGDGSQVKDKIFTFRTISKKLAEDTQEILLKLGYLSHITISSYTLTNGHLQTEYVQRVSKDSIYNRYFYPSCKKSKEHYKGLVWCPILEKNGVFLVRRNGKEFITGNCAKEFVLHALDLVNDGNKVYMFLKLTFLEGKARYKELFSKYPPKIIYVFSERVMCAKNGDFEGMKAGGGSAVAYAWFVWQKGWKGKPTIEWI